MGYSELKIKGKKREFSPQREGECTHTNAIWQSAFVSRGGERERERNDQQRVIEGWALPIGQQ